MLEVISLAVGIVGGLLGIGSGLFWYVEFNAKREIKKYAAEREFGHIKNSLSQQSVNLANFFQDVLQKLDDIESDITEIKVQCRIDNKDR
jgi:hypothetical protein